MAECKKEIECELCSKTILCKDKNVIQNTITNAKLNVCAECLNLIERRNVK